MIYLVLLLCLLALAPFLLEALRPRMDAAARKEAGGQFATLSQGVTHYAWLGPVRGPVAVCIHGLTTPGFVWRGLARGLGLLGYRVLVYDLYGRGWSDRPRGRQDAAFFLRQLDDLLKDQRLTGDLTLVGYSMGGAIATCFAAAHPDRLRRLVLLAPAGMARHPRGLTRFIAMVPLLGDWLMLASFPRAHRKAVAADAGLPSSVPGIAALQERELKWRGYVPAVLASLRGLLSRPLQAEHRALHKAGVPVLAIWGREDKVIPITAMGKLTEWNRAARHEVIEGAGHALAFTHTDAVLDALRDALTDPA